jgi:AsmA protein
MAPEPAADRARRIAASLLKFAGIGLAGVLVLAALAAIFVSSRLFTGAVERQLIATMADQKHRILKFDGPLEIRFWPNAGFQVGRVSLSEAGSDQTFASLDAARFSLRVMPLFRAQVVVDECAVDGLALAIVRHRDGTLNIDDLLGSQEPSTANVDFDVAGINATHATLTWRDDASGATTVARDLALSLHRLQGNTAARTLHADDFSLSGEVDDLRLRLAATGLSAAPTAVAAEALKFDAQAKGNESSVSAALNARFAADPERASVALDNLSGDIDIVHPRLAKPLKLPLSGALHASRLAADGELATHFDDSNATLKVRIKRFSPLTLQVDAAIDRLDIGRYLVPGHAEAAASPKTTSADLSALKSVELEGTVKVGSLKIAGIETRNIKLEIRGSHGQLDVRGAGAGAAR